MRSRGKSSTNLKTFRFPLQWKKIRKQNCSIDPLLSLTNLAIWTNTFVTCQPTNNCSTIDTATMTTVPMTTATMTTLTYGQFRQIRRSKLLRAFLKNGPFPSSFFFIFIFSIQLTARFNINVCQCLDSNCGPLESEATTLQTEPQPLPPFWFFFVM